MSYTDYFENREVNPSSILQKRKRKEKIYRPDPEFVPSVREAESFRQEVIAELDTLLILIQNAAIGEQRIRDTNDKINRLMKEKNRWDKRIKMLNGPDYAKMKMEDEKMVVDGIEYFGAAKLLPDVQEAYQRRTWKAKVKNVNEWYERIGADYYGLGECPFDKNEEEQVENEWRKTILGQRKLEKVNLGQVVRLSKEDYEKSVVAYKKKQLLASFGVKTS